MYSKNVEATQNIPTINIPYEPHGGMVACNVQCGKNLKKGVRLLSKA